MATVNERRTDNIPPGTASKIPTRLKEKTANTNCDRKGEKLFFWLTQELKGKFRSETHCNEDFQAVKNSRTKGIEGEFAKKQSGALLHWIYATLKAVLPT